MFFFWAKPFFSSLRTLTDALWNNQRNLFCQFCQYGIQRVQRNNWVKCFSYEESELFYRFWTLNEKSLEFLPETSSQLSKLYLRVQAMFTGELFFRKMCKVFCSFCKLFEWASFLSELFSAGSLKLYSRLPEDLFQEQLLVWEFFFNSSTYFGFERKILATTLLQHCQKNTFSDSETKWGKYYIGKTYKALPIFGL